MENTDIKKKRGCGFWVLVVLGVLLLLAVIGAIFGDDQQPADSSKNADSGSEIDASVEPETITIAEDRQVTSRELSQAYANNEVSAQQWANQGTIQVTGQIESIELDFMDNPVLQLQGSEMFQTVSVYFDKDVNDAIGSLSKGQSVTVICDDVSEVMGFPQLNECTLAGV